MEEDKILKLSRDLGEAFNLLSVNKGFSQEEALKAFALCLVESCIYNDICKDAFYFYMDKIKELYDFIENISTKAEEKMTGVE